MTTVSIFIRTRNEAEALINTMRSIRDQERNVDEVVVLDNESSDTTEEVARKSGALIVRIPKEQFSYGRALNMALTHTNGDIVVFLSAHSPPVTRRWLGALITPIEKEVHRACYGRQIPMPGVNALEEWTTYRTFPKKISTLGTALGLQTPAFSNANSALCRELLEAEPFREDLAFAEDREWSDRLRRKGVEIAYCPEAAVYHSHAPDGVQERMQNVGGAMRQQGYGSVYRSPLTRLMIQSCTMLIDVIYCIGKGYWGTIPSIRRYRTSYFRGLLRGLRDEPERKGSRGGRQCRKPSREHRRRHRS